MEVFFAAAGRFLFPPPPSVCLHYSAFPSAEHGLMNLLLIILNRKLWGQFLIYFPCKAVGL